MAQRQRRDWRDAFSILHHFWQSAPARERQSRCPLEPVLGRTLVLQELILSAKVHNRNLEALKWILSSEAMLVCTNHKGGNENDGARADFIRTPGQDG
jgi:hypothetical protein